MNKPMKRPKRNQLVLRRDTIAVLTSRKLDEVRGALCDGSLVSAICADDADDN